VTVQHRRQAIRTGETTNHFWLTQIDQGIVARRAIMRLAVKGPFTKPMADAAVGGSYGCSETHLARLVKAGALRRESRNARNRPYHYVLARPWVDEGA
jgi:hypothetical protein